MASENGIKLKNYEKLEVKYSQKQDRVRRLQAQVAELREKNIRQDSTIDATQTSLE